MDAPHAVVAYDDGLCLRIQVAEAGRDRRHRHQLRAFDAREGAPSRGAHGPPSAVPRRQRNGALAERSERFRRLYAALGLAVVGCKAGALEVTWGLDCVSLRARGRTLAGTTVGVTFRAVVGPGGEVEIGVVS